MSKNPTFVVYTRRRFNIDPDFPVENIINILVDQFKHPKEKAYSLVALVGKEKRVLSPKKKLKDQGIDVNNTKLELIRSSEVDGTYILKRQFSVRRQEINGEVNKTPDDPIKAFERIRPETKFPVTRPFDPSMLEDIEYKSPFSEQMGVAQENYEAESENCLSVRKGDKIFLQASEEGWLYGIINGKGGWIPERIMLLQNQIQINVPVRRQNSLGSLQDIKEVGKRTKGRASVSRSQTEVKAATNTAMIEVDIIVPAKSNTVKVTVSPGSEFKSLAILASSLAKMKSLNYGIWTSREEDPVLAIHRGYFVDEYASVDVDNTRAKLYLLELTRSVIVKKLDGQEDTFQYKSRDLTKVVLDSALGSVNNKNNDYALFREDDTIIPTDSPLWSHPIENTIVFLRMKEAMVNVFLSSGHQASLRVNYLLPVKELMVLFLKKFEISEKTGNWHCEALRGNRLDPAKNLVDQNQYPTAQIVLKSAGSIERRKPKYPNIWNEGLDGATWVTENFNGFMMKIIHFGTLNQLIIYLTVNQEGKPSVESMQKMFLLSYRNFVGADDLLGQILSRYNVPTSVPLGQRQDIQKNVCMFLLTWVNMFNCKDFSHELTVMFVDWIDEVLSKSQKNLSTQLRKAIIERTNGFKFNPYFPCYEVDGKPGDMPKNPSDIWAYKDVDIARQITLVFHEYLCEIEPTDILNHVKVKKSKGVENNVTVFNEKSNYLGFWSSYEVLKKRTPKERALIISRLVRICDNLLALGNINCFYVIVAQLAGGSAIVRLKETFKCLDKTSKKKLEEWNKKITPDIYRELLAPFMDGSAIPYLGFQVMKLIHLDEMKMKDDKKRINFLKCKKMQVGIEEILNFQRRKFKFFKVTKMAEYFYWMPRKGEKELYEISKSLE